MCRFFFNMVDAVLSNTKFTVSSILFLFQVDIIPTKINGYFCDDISLKYPHVILKKSKLHVVCEGVILSLIAVRNFLKSQT